jgi:gliding motility-associated-like protein
LLTSIGLKAGGNYYATATVNGCTGPAATSTVIVDQQALVSAGSDQIICASASSVNLFATITGNQKTGIWSTLGTGTFSNGASPVTTYSPSVADKTAGSVVLYLTSTNNGACPSASAGLTIRFTPLPLATAGPDVTVCANDAKVALSAAFTNASGGLWTSSGTGNFTPSANAPNAVYLPGTRDKTEGSAKLVWTTTGNGACPAASDEMVISIKQPPSVNTGATQSVLENNSVVLKPVVAGTRLSYNWSPATFLDKDTVRDPLCTPLQSITYKLSVQDEFGCTASGDLTVKLIRHPVIPNVFTPNGDGINDTWQVKNLPEYNDCLLNIYNRYGQVVYKTTGYDKEWDGSANGRPLPAGTYYYIIDLKTGAKPLSGFVDIVR